MYTERKHENTRPGHKELSVLSASEDSLTTNHRAYLTRTRWHVSCWKICQECSFANQIRHDLQRWSATMSSRKVCMNYKNKEPSARNGQAWFPPSRHPCACSAFTTFSYTLSTGSIQIFSCITRSAAIVLRMCMYIKRCLHTACGLDGAISVLKQSLLQQSNNVWIVHCSQTSKLTGKNGEENPYLCYKN